MDNAIRFDETDETGGMDSQLFESVHDDGQRYSYCVRRGSLGRPVYWLVNIHGDFMAGVFASLEAAQVAVNARQARASGIEPTDYDRRTNYGGY